MARLNQIIAVEKGRKSAAEDTITKAYHMAQKSDLFNGQRRDYEPLDEEGTTLPSEVQNVIATVNTVIEEFSAALGALTDITSVKVAANTRAYADVVVDGVTVVTQAPVEFLLFLEKRLQDIITFIGKLPTLDPAINWTVDVATGLYRSEPVVRNSTKKVYRNHVKAEATDKHPAQVEVYTEDEVVGHWTTVKTSGAVPATQLIAWKIKAQALLAAVKFAREEANNIEVTETSGTGDAVLGYVFGS